MSKSGSTIYKSKRKSALVKTILTRTRLILSSLTILIIVVVVVIIIIIIIAIIMVLLMHAN